MNSDLYFCFFNGNRIDPYSKTCTILLATRHSDRSDNESSTNYEVSFDSEHVFTDPALSMVRPLYTIDVSKL